MAQRRKIRVDGLKVIHRHRAGELRSLRVSELAFVNGVPRAVLEWIDLGGMRSPIYVCNLDPAKLRVSRTNRHTFYYPEETVDPRYEPVKPAAPH